jgi:DNA-binding transcriptional LysR family regulator
MGIHATRARMLLPHVIPAFRAKYPNVYLNFIYGNMAPQLEMLKKGELDMVFGVNPDLCADFHYTNLRHEDVYFVSSVDSLQRKNVDHTDGIIMQQELERFDYILSPDSSVIYKRIAAFQKSVGLNLHSSMNISDYELQLMIVASGEGACFCPDMLMRKLLDINRTAQHGHTLIPLKIQGFNFSNSLSIVRHKHALDTEESSFLIASIQKAINNPVFLHNIKTG